MRSMLVALGHPLYSEVSSDQPPLFNHILALLLRVLGFEVNPARLLVLLFSTLLVWSGAQFLQLTWGKPAAIVFLPLITMAPEYLQLSVSVMIGLPSIALAAVSMLFVALWHQKKNNLWLVLSGCMLALSVLTKLFTGLLAPVFIAGMTASMYFSERQKRFSWKILQPAWIWSISFACLTALLGLILVGPQNILSIIMPHATAPTIDWLQGPGYSINTRLQEAVPLLLLASLGAPLSIYRRNWITFYPLAWLILAYVLFSFYSPVFYHHQLLVTVPASLLAAAAVGDGIGCLFRSRRSFDLFQMQTLLGLGALIGFIWVSIHYMPVLDQQLMNRPRFTDFSLKTSPQRARVIRTMNE